MDNKIKFNELSGFSFSGPVRDIARFLSHLDKNKYYDTLEYSCGTFSISLVKTTIFEVLATLVRIHEYEADVQDASVVAEPEPEHMEEVEPQSEPEPQSEIEPEIESVVSSMDMEHALHECAGDPCPCKACISDKICGFCDAGLGEFKGINWEALDEATVKKLLLDYTDLRTGTRTSYTKSFRNTKDKSPINFLEIKSLEDFEATQIKNYNKDTRDGFKKLVWKLRCILPKCYLKSTAKGVAGDVMASP